MKSDALEPLRLLDSGELLDCDES